MQKSTAGSLKIHASIRPKSIVSETAATPAAKRKLRIPRPGSKNGHRKLSLGDRLLRNTAIACALLLGVLTIHNIDQPWSNLALDGIESALTMKIDLDESLGRLSFVRDLVPESALVFLDISAQSAFSPVEGMITHSYSADQPWIIYQCAPAAEVRAFEPATVSAVTQLSSGDWGILLDHGDGLESIYAYLEEVCIQTGDRISAGDVLGKASSNGATDVYFELRKNGTAIDPAERLSF